MSDWANHLSTIFPEVRLKRYLEMRGADVGPPDHIAALSAFFVGLLYDRSALDAAWDLVKGWNAAERQALRDAVPALALGASIQGRPAREVAREALRIARAGLAARRRMERAGRDETIFLDILDERVASGRVAAQELLEKHRGAWKESVLPAFEDCVF
jgi:glutamate--cysteine ligase